MVNTSLIFFKNLIKELKINVTPYNIVNNLRRYEDLPNLNEVSFILLSWNVKSIIITDIPDEKIREFPVPYITTTNNGQFIIVTAMSDNKFTCFFPDSSFEEVISSNDFLLLSSDIFLLMEANSDSGEFAFPLKNKNLYNYKLSRASVFFGALFFLATAAFSINGESIIFYISSIIGLSISIFLLSKKYNLISSESLSSICKIGKVADCESILKSTASTFLGFSLAEISSAYFLFLILNVFFTSQINLSLNYLTPIIIISMIAVPYSLYHQLRLKSFCLYCFAILILLITQSILFFKQYEIGFNQWNVSVLIVFFTSIGLAFLVVGTIKIASISLSQMKEKDQFLQSLLDSKMVLNSFTESTIKPKSFNHEIIIGANHASITLILFINPLCSRCKDILKQLPRLFSQYSDLISLRVLYSGSPDNRSLEKIMMSELHQILKNENDKLKILSEYKGKISNNGKFRKDILESLNEQYEWSNQLQLEGTPAIILNNIVLPAYFGMEELLQVIGMILEKEQSVGLNNVI